MYKMIASDLDETLLNRSDKKVSQQNREAIAKAQKQGAHFVVATGRPFFTVQGTLKEIDQYQKEGKYSIVLNGAQVVEHGSGKPLFTESVPFDTVQALFERSLPQDLGCHIYTDDEVYGYRCDEGEIDYLKGRMIVHHLDKPDLSFLKDRVLTKILFVNTDQPYLQEFEKQVRDLTGDMEISYSSNRYLEFNKKGVTKGKALLKLGEILGINRDEIIAVGDNYNDLAMIKDAGLGVGVSNSNPDIIKDCDVITEHDCDHGAVAEVIEKYILKSE